MKIENKKTHIRILIDFRLQKHPILAPQNDPKTIKKTQRKKNKKIIKKSQHGPKKQKNLT